MLSILIPVYQFDVRELVTELLRQGRSLATAFEIRVYDDASPGEVHWVNRVLSNEPEVHYLELNQNLGRAAIRNRLARDAQFSHLLFLDGDSAVVRPDFLQVYLQSANSTHVLHGGTAYAAQPPPTQSAYLRWHYGRHREVRSPAERQTRGHQGFSSNNFLVPKTIFLQVGFDETIKGYGHEDTLFGLSLAKRRIPIQYIDNPLEHVGLESAGVFLKKTRVGVHNLKKIYETGKPIDATLLRWYLSLRQWKVDRWLGYFGKKWLPALERQLSSSTPRLLFFDLYKLILICMPESSENHHH